MKIKKHTNKRRQFISNLGLSMGALTLSPIAYGSTPPLRSIDDDNLNIIGPKKGFTPQIGTLASMMNWMRDTILYPVRGMSIKDLDYLHDDNSNTIGAMLWHLAATERFYQLNTFANVPWGEWPAKDRKEWSTAMGLGKKGRSTIKGNPLDFYLEKLETIRALTLKEFAKRDDDWLMAVDESWGWGPTNNYCKWFHVCEHESNHNGQIKYIKSRIQSS